MVIINEEVNKQLNNYKQLLTNLVEEWDFFLKESKIRFTLDVLKVVVQPANIVALDLWKKFAEQPAPLEKTREAYFQKDRWHPKGTNNHLHDIFQDLREILPSCKK